MPTKHTEKPKKPLWLRITMYVILAGVILLGIYLLKPSLPQKSFLHPPCQYDKDVCAYLSRLEDPATYYSGPFTVSILTTLPDASKSRVAIRSDAINNLDIITYKEHILTGQSVVIDNIVYKRNVQTNKWLKTSETVNPVFVHMKEKSLAEVTKSGQGISYKLIGDSKCGKKTCMKYQLITNELSKTKTYVLFTQTNHMLKEIIKYAPDGTVTDILFVYTDVTITPPPTL